MLLELILGHVARRLHNWTYRDVTDFLRESGFSFLEELGGSHQRWGKRGENDEPDRFVEVSFRHDSNPVMTMKKMIRQSGIDEEAWIKWGSS